MRKWLITFIRSFQVIISENVFKKLYIDVPRMFLYFYKHPRNMTLSHDKDVIEKIFYFFLKAYRKL